MSTMLPVGYISSWLYTLLVLWVTQSFEYMSRLNKYIFFLVGLCKAFMTLFLTPKSLKAIFALRAYHFFSKET